MDKFEPLVSVVMPCYNEEKTAGRAIESILNQTFKQFEFIIIDDESSDNTPNILKDYEARYPQIRVLTNKQNLGYAGSINKGIKAATTSIIARMDADDYSFPERLEKQFNFLQKNPDVGVVGTGVELVMKKNGKKTGMSILPQTHQEIMKGRYSKSFNFHPTVMARKEVFLDFNGYDESIKRAEELDLWLRASRKYKFHNLPEVLLRFSVNDPNKIKYSYWFYGFKVRLMNMWRRGEMLSNGHELLIYSIKFFARKLLKLRPRYLGQKK